MGVCLAVCKIRSCGQFRHVGHTGVRAHTGLWAIFLKFSLESFGSLRSTMSLL
ncbi:hypothetical protein F383_13904 [Gossypium arboreum]|uniref:Uncharacterized protein n=1 Tax=Gossypium arboreum TaxID=29729 RepID=A0A0B0PU80_GOSAR|nr:hypothetical protein F383_13904 [Gossypium arboreum]